MKYQHNLANAIRFLSVDAIQKAKSGHPGMPLGMADIATVLWREFLKHNPQNPKWPNRDRFVLSNGHGSMLLYALLYLTGYEVSIKDIQNFRQLNSKTPGHPEFDCIRGIETTTGPLGQGLANAVGMAIAEKVLSAQFNKKNFNIFDHYTYVFVGDGCLMEGLSHEVSSLAGTHGLGKLIVFWDNNHISVDGNTKDWFTEDVAKRYKSYNWHIIQNIDGHDITAIRKAITAAQSITDKPSIICCKTIIGFGAPNLNNNKSCHGAPLGEEEIAAMRIHLKWTHDPFIIPSDILANWNMSNKGNALESKWKKLFDAYCKIYKTNSDELCRRLEKKLPQNWQKKCRTYIKQSAKKLEHLSTRQFSQKALNHYGSILPEFLGGSADLTSSNLTKWINCKDITKNNASGNYLHYGVREFGMFAIMNGISLHGGFIPYGGTFLVFANYALGAIRTAAMMKQRVIYVLTHDSIGIGEDGPTHQPVEQLTMLRSIPNLSVWRPSNNIETAVAWQYAIEHTDGPTAIILTRQNVSTKNNYNTQQLVNIKKGAYIILEPHNTPNCILISTGSEIPLTVSIANKLNKQGSKIRVVAMPSQNIFDRQNKTYKNKVLPANITKRIAIEAASSLSWYKYVGSTGKIIGIDTYGKSAPGEILFEFFGFSEHNITRAILTL